MQVIDTHAHVSDFNNIKEVLTRAKKAGVNSIIAVSVNQETCKKTLKYAEKYPNILIPALGIHPNDFFKEDIDKSIDLIKQNIKKCKAIGEIGLDYWNKNIKKNRYLLEKQKILYQFFLELANDLKLPASIHSRGSWNDAIKMAQKYGPKKIVFHWYSGPVELIPDILNFGYYISCTPALLSSNEQKNAILNMPLERILVETDSPVFYKNLGRHSEPADVILTLNLLAELKELSLEEVIEVTTKNAKTLFNI